ncbi:MAG: hypothetical protein FWD54_04525 [Endomicrobia bacterium]|nr:hypothetical protein [Endomicrobiia bacterium]
MKKTLMLLIAFALYFTMAAPCIYGEQKSDPIPIDSLFNDLKAGTISFEFDDPVTVTGYVLETGISKYLTPYVSLSNEKGGRQYAVCVLPRADSLKLKDFAKDEKVVIEGSFYAFREDKVVIKKCRKINK